MIKIGQYNCIKQTASSEFYFLSRDRISNSPYKMHMSVFSWDPTLRVKQYLEHLMFLEYILGVEHEGGKNADGRRSNFDVIESIKIYVSINGIKF